MKLAPDQHLFLSGIGGVSMSGLAHAMLDLGYRVSGSDITDSAATAALRDAGIPVFSGHAAANLAGADVVVRTTAIADDNAEIVEARRLGLPIYHRSELLAWMCRGRRGIAITGTHGKSTTTGMAAAIYLHAGLDPAVFVGGEFPLIGGNYHLGHGPHIIFEACESDGTFLNYTNCSQVLTSVEADHLDQHGTLEGVIAAFRAFVAIADPAGYLVYNANDPTVRSVAASSPARRIAYSIDGAPAQLQARDVEISPDGSRFILAVDGVPVGPVRLPVLGRHNVADALAALGCAWADGLDLLDACRALAEFTPVGRRFQLIATWDGIRVVDDYAHHPTEIRATLAAARASHPGRIIAIFQPHLRSRTRDLLTDFGRAFHDADLVVLTDVYQARDDGTEAFDINTLVQEVRSNEPGKAVQLVHDKDAVAAQLGPKLRSGDLVLTIGAGDIWKVAHQLAPAEVVP